jgi:hypothetical protein
MKLEVRKTHEFYRAICIDENFLKEMQAIILKTCKEIVLIAIQKNGNKITFDSMEELIHFDNPQNNKLVTLKVTGLLGFKEIIEIKFEFFGGALTAYSTTVRYSYAFPGEEDAACFLLKFKSLLNAATCKYWWIGKCGTYLLVLTFCWVIVLVNIINGNIINDIRNGINFTVKNFISTVIGIIIIIGLRIFDRRIWLDLFEPVAFCIGKGVQQFKRKESIRFGLLWSFVTVIIALFFYLIT